MGITIPVGISACLLGENVRYDGKNKLNPLFCGKVTEKIRWIPVCPEVEFGLGVPREPIHLAGDLSEPRLLTVQSNRDLSEAMREFCRKRVDELAELQLAGFVFKARSPSCGLRVPVFQSDGYSAGYFATEWKRRFPDVPVAEAEELEDLEKFRDFLKALERR